MNPCACDHQCFGHPLKVRTIGEGNACLLSTLNSKTKVQTFYMIDKKKVRYWSDWFRKFDIDSTKFEKLLLRGLTLEQAREKMS